MPCHDKVALRRQQAQEEAEARQLGVEILKPGDRADLVIGSGGLRRQQTGEAEAGDSDSDKVEMEIIEQKQIKVDTTDTPEQGLLLMFTRLSFEWKPNFQNILFR